MRSIAPSAHAKPHCLSPILTSIRATQEVRYCLKPIFHAMIDSSEVTDARMTNPINLKLMAMLRHSLEAKMVAKYHNSPVEQSPITSIEPRDFELGENWFDPDFDPQFRERILGLLLKGQLPGWALMIPPEMRVSRKLAFHLGHQIVVVAGVGLVQRERDHLAVSTPRVDERAPETTLMHDSYISQLDLRRDPLGGLGAKTLALALRRMAAARTAAGSLGIIPHVLAHGIMFTRRRSALAFLVYSYPVGVEKPMAWIATSEDFCRGMENMARFLAALHRKLFHGHLYRPEQGFVNTLWTTDERVIPVITGWGQHAGLINPDLAVRDLENLIQAGVYQLQIQRVADRDYLGATLVRRVLTAYGEMSAAFKEHEFDFERDPLTGWKGNLDSLAREHELIEQFIAQG